VTDLLTRTLGRTGLTVTVLGFGAMELRGVEHRLPRPLEPGQAERVLNGVLDAGINFIDTSIDYGASETHMGNAIAHRRDEYVLASKCGCPLNAHQMKDGFNPLGSLPHDFSAANVIAGVEQSLRRLKTDHLDVVQLHANPTANDLMEGDTIAALEKLREQGKTRFIGITCTLPRLAEHLDSDAFDVVQLPYSALDRTHEEVMTVLGEKNVGLVVRGAVAQGEPGESHALHVQGDPWAAWKEAGLDDLLEGTTRTGWMLRYVMAHPHTHTMIVGTADLGHLQSNVEAAKLGPLPADIVGAANDRLAALNAQ
jgi:aryl-alcohol dehydrogenase-like predicted oxidoreductase